MPVAIQTTLKGSVEYNRSVGKLIPNKNPKAQSVAMRALGFLIQSVAAGEKIKRGGSAAPLKNKLTSRTGTGRRSIRTDFTRLPGEVVVGSDLKYMAVHEEGGTFSVKASNVAAHIRTKAFGKTFKPFNVPKHKRKAHNATFPRRAWLEPAINAVVPKRAEEIFAREWAKQAGVGS